MNNQGFSEGRSYGSMPVVEETEGAARKGFLDARDGKGFREEYDAASKKWQRNYETGRLWIAAMREVGIEPGDWREGVSRPDQMGLLTSKQTLDRVVVPMEGQSNPEDPDLDLHAIVPVRTRRGVTNAISRRDVQKAQPQALRRSGAEGRQAGGSAGEQGYGHGRGNRNREQDRQPRDAAAKGKEGKGARRDAGQGAAGTRKAGDGRAVVAAQEQRAGLMGLLKSMWA